VAALASDAERGLGQAEVRARLERHGRNELTAERPVPAWRKFLGQFRDVLVILLLIATAISVALWLYERESAWPYEAMAIFAVVLLNAVMGYVQQSRAEQAVAALRQMSAADAHVVRDGTRQTVPATDLVPGDIILVEEGDTIPADARLIESTALQSAEAALTGESVPVEKHTRPISEEAGLGDRQNMILSGTAATYGHGQAVIVATGMHTEMGRIAGMLKEVPTETTPLQKELARVGRVLAIIVVVIAVVAAIAYWILQHRIIASQGGDSILKRAIGSDWKGKLSPLLYVAAIVLAFVSPWLAVSIYVLAAIMWVIPDRRIEHVLIGKDT
jgi:Ca2+-transporting ATPase